MLDLTKTPTPAKGESLSKFVYSKITNIFSGKAAETFVTNVISLCAGNPGLLKCDQNTLVSACLEAYRLGLSFDKNLGRAYIVPRNDSKNNRVIAVFQIGYRGLIQLAIETEQYRKINALSLKRGEVKEWNPLEETLTVELKENRENIPTEGYYASFELLNGFKKAIYWTKGQMERHAQSYVPAFKNKTPSLWVEDFDAMATKTMLRQLLSKWGVISLKLNEALKDKEEADDAHPLSPVKRGRPPKTDGENQSTPQQSVVEIDSPEKEVDNVSNDTALLNGGGIMISQFAELKKIMEKNKIDTADILTEVERITGRYDLVSIAELNKDEAGAVIQHFKSSSWIEAVRLK